MNVVLTHSEKEKIFSTVISNMSEEPLYETRYLNLGVYIIRILCYSKEVIPILKNQMGYVIRDTAEHFDSTIAVWKISDYSKLLNDVLRTISANKRMRIRAEMLWMGQSNPYFDIQELNLNKCSNIGCFHGTDQYIEIFDDETRTAFCGYSSFEPEEFVKQGHVFVRAINHLIKTKTTNLTHGAVFGCFGNGFLLCGRGKRGKSTLTIESMLNGFEYVSDDYQILKFCEGSLFAYPIYSIITLSHRMYNEMYDRFNGKFVCNNFIQDKYIFNIDCYHSQFKSKYPIRLCLFPEIVADEHPSIVTCTSDEKGRAITQFIHSTLMQMGELSDTDTIEKLLLMVKDLPFYKFNLCSKIEENTEYLQTYLSTFDVAQSQKIYLQTNLLDVAFGLATILNTKTYQFTTMNKFATNIFLLLLSGVNCSEIKDYLKQFEIYNIDILNEFEKLKQLISDRGYDEMEAAYYLPIRFQEELAQKSAYRLSVMEYNDNQAIELLK